MTDVEDAVIADRNPVGVPTEVLKDSPNAIERGFAIDDPLFAIELTPESLKVPGLLKMMDTVGEYKGIGLEAFLKEVKELPLEQRRYHPDGDEEPLAR